MSNDSILLFALYNCCHFIGDFTPLSTSWMLHAKQFGKPYLPIFVHATIHASLMGIISLLFFNPTIAFELFSIQLLAHFSIDTLKGKLSYWFPNFQDNSKKAFWMLFGLDQLAHQLTIVVMLYWVAIKT